MEAKLTSLEKEVKELKAVIPSSDIILARKLVMAVERRFIDMLVDGTDARYFSVSALRADVQHGTADALVAGGGSATRPSGTPGSFHA